MRKKYIISSVIILAIILVCTTVFFIHANVDDGNNVKTENREKLEELQKASQDIIELTLDYSAKKILLKEKEAKLMLETDFEEVLGKKRPTVDEKKAYITLQTLKDKEALDKSTAEMEKAKRTYEIRKLECKMTGNFLNTIARKRICHTTITIFEFYRIK